MNYFPIYRTYTRQLYIVVVDKNFTIVVMVYFSIQFIKKKKNLFVYKFHYSVTRARVLASNIQYKIKRAPFMQMQTHLFKYLFIFEKK